MTYKQIEQKILSCGANAVGIGKKGIAVYWPTRRKMRAAVRIMQEKGLNTEYETTKHKSGWYCFGGR